MPTAVYVKDLLHQSGRQVGRNAANATLHYVADRAKRAANDYIDGQFNKRRNVTPPRTPKKKPTLDFKIRRRGSRNAGPARSGGFISTRKVKKTKLRKLSKRGVDYTMEVGGATSATDAMYIGHITAPVEVLIQNGVRAMFKDMFLKAQYDVSDVTAVIGFTATDSLVVNFTEREGVPMSLITLNLTPLDSINSITTWFTASARPWGTETTSVSDQILFHSIQFRVGDVANTIASPVLVMLKHCKVHFAAKSALKMQNRTVNTVGDDDVDEVDNVPLSGMCYEGHGTGAVYIRKSTTGGTQPTFVGSNNQGMILLKPGASYNAPEEPPNPSNFDKIKKEAKVKLEPGEIKTSVLKWEKSMSFNNFWQATHPHGVGLTTVVRKPLGEFRFFGMEKMIHFAAADTAIQTVYEHQYDLGSTVSYSRAIQSVKYFQAFRDVNL